MLVDPDALERVARVLDHVADEYRGLARELHAFPSLTGPAGGLVDAERHWVASGLDGLAASLSHTASRLRDRARYAREADTDSRRPPPFPGGPPRWPLLLPQSSYGPSLLGPLGVRKGVGNKTYADQQGGRAMFFYDTGTPDTVIQFAKQRLGAENVQPIP